MLRKVLIGIGLVLVSAATLVGCVALRSGFGDVSVGVLAALSGAAAWVANAIAKSIAEDSTLAVRDLGLSQKEAAGRIDLGIASACRQLAGQERFDYARWAQLDGFELAFAKRRAARSADGYLVMDGGLVAAALEKLSRLVDPEVAA